jgi:hypothetical protein
MKRLIILVLVVLVCGGCYTIHITPDKYPVHPEEVSSFKSNDHQQVHIINNTQDEEVFLGTNDLGMSFKGNLKDWTTVAVDLIKSEFEERGFIVAKTNINKTLRISISQAQFFETAINCRCNLMLDVEAGNGYIKEYSGNNATSSFTCYSGRAPGGAITKAITLMLNDQNIINYLTEKGPKPLESPVKDSQREINYPDGSKYVGDIINGMKQGQGTYTWPDGNKYVGEFKGDRASGGWLYKSDGSKEWCYQNSQGNWLIKKQ